MEARLEFVYFLQGRIRKRKRGKGEKKEEREEKRKKRKRGGRGKEEIRRKEGVPASPLVVCKKGSSCSVFLIVSVRPLCVLLVSFLPRDTRLPAKEKRIRTGN
jgi:hypothetical protein